MTSNNVKDIKKQVKRNMNKYEWTKELDTFLMQSVIRNYFNFQVVNLEINQEIKNLGLDFGAANVFTSEKCRYRWSYLHLQRKMGKQVVYKAYASASESETNKENKHEISNKAKPIPIKDDGSRLSQLRKSNSKPSENSQSAEIQKSAPKPTQSEKASQPIDSKQAFEQKDFNKVTDKKEPKTMADIEAQLWKNNIKQGQRKKNDFLDASNEDFTKQVSKGIDGRDVVPSSFNIFRDSLRQASEKLHETLIQHLPELNLKDITESESEADDDVLPLDFRTAMIEKENRVVIQAKPLTFKAFEEDEEEADKKKARDQFGIDAYLDSVRKEAFGEDEGAIMIEPDFNIKDKFEQINLPCMVEERVNNTFNAPLRPKQFEIKQKNKMPASGKTYDTDTDTNEQEEEKVGWVPVNFEKAQQSNTFKSTLKEDDPLSFDASLKEVGLHNIDALVGSDHTKAGIVSEIVKQNRRANRRRVKKEEEQERGATMLDGLEEIAEEAGGNPPLVPDESADSDFAPVSPYADVPTIEEEKKMAEAKRKADFLKAVNIVSSASEDESGANKDEKIKKLEQLQKQTSQNKAQISATKAKKVKFYKGQRVLSDTEDLGGYASPTKAKAPQDKINDDPDASSSSRSSHGSADEYFNQQRKAIRQKLVPTKVEEPEVKAAQVQAPQAKVAPKTRELVETESSEEENDNDYEKRIQAERKAQMEAMEKRKREQEQIEQQRRIEQLKRQQEMVAAEQAKKTKEKEDLMNKLKKQDEERKKRKREEKEKKERELRLYREHQEELRIIEEERQEKIRQQEKEETERVERHKKIKAERERRMEEMAEDMNSEEQWLANGKTDVGCLFDVKCSFLSKLHQLPLDLEDKIAKNQVDEKDISLNRYKALMIPLDRHIDNGILSALLQYFLANSTMAKVYEQAGKSNIDQQPKFEFQCISAQFGVTKAPLTAPSLTELKPNEDHSGKAIRVLSLLFDTHSVQNSKYKNFEEVLKNTKLSQILTSSQLNWIKQNYKTFIMDLVQKYVKEDKLKQFPFEIQSAVGSQVTFKNNDTLNFVPSLMNLGHIAFFTRYSMKDDIVPLKSMESFELFRRHPTLWAFNMNKHSYSSFDKNKKNNKRKVITKNNLYEYEEACVVFKDISFDPVCESKHNNSLSYFLKKAIVNLGLDICGMRMLYLGDKQREEYYNLFHQKFEAGDSWDQPVLAIALRGLDAQRKVDQILGHFNPETARRNNEKSLRAIFGRNRDKNCVLQVFNLQHKYLDLRYFFGGRAHIDFGAEITEEDTSISKTAMIVPTAVEKQLLFLSPCVPSFKLPQILQRLATMGVTVFEVQKLNFASFQYMAGDIDKLRREAFTTVRGRIYKSEIGYVLKVARENIHSQFFAQMKNLMIDLDGLLEEYKIDELLYLTSNFDEYKKVLGILKKGGFKTNYTVEDVQKNKKESKDYDSDEPEQYKDLQMWNKQIDSAPKTARKSSPIKPKVSPMEAESKYLIGTCLCFIKMSSFKKQVIGNTLQAILNKMDVELLGTKIVRAKKDLYLDNVPREVRKVFKMVAYKFYAENVELKLRKKIGELSCLMLVLRGQNIEGQIDSVYDREKLKFRAEMAPGLEDLSYKLTPHVLFVSNCTQKEPVIDFLLQTKYMNMYLDTKQSFTHLNDSREYSEKYVEPSLKVKGEIDTQKYVEVKKMTDLLDQGYLTPMDTIPPTNAVCVIKPNQPFNVLLRSLKSIANINPQGLTPKDQNYVSISKIEYVTKYNKAQLDLLFDHDIMFDENLSNTKKLRYRSSFYEMFEDKPVLQLVISGQNAIAKLKELVGAKDPKQSTKSDTLRSFYGVDRLDNGFIISESVHEAQVEIDALFAQQGQEIDISQYSITELFDRETQNDLITPVSHIMKANLPELACVVISPTLVKNNDFVFVIDEFHRAKFNIVAIKKRSLSKEEIEQIFKSQIPRVHHLEPLDQEFKRGESVIVVLEKAKAIKSCNTQIGNFSIKAAGDFLKLKKTGTKGFQFKQSQFEEDQLITEYGSFIFAMQDIQTTNDLILKEFRELPNTKSFKITKKL